MHEIEAFQLKCWINISFRTHTTIVPFDIFQNHKNVVFFFLKNHFYNTSKLFVGGVIPQAIPHICTMRSRQSSYLSFFSLRPTTVASHRVPLPIGVWLPSHLWLVREFELLSFKVLGNDWIIPGLLLNRVIELDVVPLINFANRFLVAFDLFPLATFLTSLWQQASLRISETMLELHKSFALRTNTT